MSIRDTRDAFRRALLRQLDRLGYTLFPQHEEWNETVLGSIGYPNLEGAQVFTKWDEDRLIISDRGSTMARLRKYYGIDALPLDLVEGGRVKFENETLFAITNADDALEDYLRFRNVLSMMMGAAWQANRQRLQ